MSLSPAYLTVHLNGGKRMIEGLIEYKKTKLIGVSMLTSLDQNDLKKSGYNVCDEISYVERLVKIGASSELMVLCRPQKKLSYS